MKMTNLASGSSGNCTFLFLEDDLIVLFDIGITFRQLNLLLLEYDIDLKGEDLRIILLVTHEHQDHWNKKAFVMLNELPNIDVTLVFPEVDTFSQLIHGYSIDSKRFKHGTTHTNFFIVDNNFGYLTDVEGNELFNIITWNQAYDLTELFIEANYDEEYLKYIEQASISNGYNVNIGFERHLSIQQSKFLVETLRPKAHWTMHHSSRFYDASSLKEED